MSIIKKITIFLGIFFISCITQLSAQEIKKIGKYKDWEAMVVSDADGKVCFAQSIPVLQAPKKDKRDSRLFSGAYGWGDIGERGLVPMPGITGIQTKYYNNGALSEATINIRCYSKLQFAIIDTLYLRPGYTLLLEFGNSNENLFSPTVSVRIYILLLVCV